jgi:hypothetical protein
MRTNAARLVAAAILLLLGGGAARANGNGQCIKDAKNTFTECKGQCKGDFDDARALCKNVSPGCFEACLDGRAECVDTARQPLTTCLDGCEATLHQHRLDCKASSGCGGSGNPCSSNASFIACMNPFQLDAFTCRDGCRDSFRLDTGSQAALKACAKGFKTCVKSCPPASPSGAFLGE